MRRLLSVLIYVVATSPLCAQEICNNGIDDDTDGLVDCFDPDCGSNNDCQDSFIVGGCQMEAPVAPAFTMTLDFASENETTNHFARMAIGDLDGDGMPEIITMNKYTKKLIILNGNDGSIKNSITMTASATPEWEIAIANIPNGNGDCAEIFFLGTDSRIYVYDCNLNFLYRTNAMPGSNDPINFGLADFDGDGMVEIYCKDQIFDAHSGRRLVATTLGSSNWGNNLNGGPVAVDMEGTSNLELVIGLSIYQVNIPAGRGTDAGSLTLLASRPEYFIRNQYNATSVADFDQDGTLDVIASGSTVCAGKNTTIFYWNRTSNTIKTYSDHNSVNGDSDYAHGWKNGTGRVNIADLDGDGELNLSYVSGGFLYALKENMTKLWKVAINEETSGYTGCTLFDFNGDGKSEIVYRDEQYLYIIDGTDGSIFNSQPCVSRTNREYPIVADVDADGSTEICVTCGYDDALSLANFNTTSYSQYSHVRVFKSAAEPWVPARRVWNQHGYFVVNVNDDLTIPKIQTKHQTRFSTNVSCRNEAPRDQRPLNKFLNQSPYLNTDGCPSYSAPNISISGSIAIQPPTCPDLDFRVTFTIVNTGVVSFTGDLPISFYNKNPNDATATKLATITYSGIDLDENETREVDTIINSGGADSLWVVLNDAGNTIPLSQPNTDVLECTYEDPTGVAIKPLPVTLTAVPLTDHQNCIDPATGSARAYVLTAGAENTTDYNFYWFNGTPAGPIASADFTGSTYTGMIDGVYQIYAIHKTANCSSDTTQATIALAIGGGLPVVNITLVSNQTSCNPPNGSLQALVEGPAGNAGYTFSWEDSGAPIGITSALLTNQPAGTYLVIASKNGCTTSQDASIGDQTIEPDISAVPTPVTDCADLTSGSVTATALLGGVAQPPSDYTFAWYFYDNVTSTRGSVVPAQPDGTGPTRANLAPGYYEAVATRISTECESPAPFVVQILDNTSTPSVTIVETQAQTSCDPLNPNGKLRADVYIGGVLQPAANFKYEWFVGQNTITPHSGGTEGPVGIGTQGQTANHVKGGGQAYTVRITTSTNCTAADDEVVSETINIPVVTLTPGANGICNPALAMTSSGVFTGSVTAAITVGGTPIVAPYTGYQFEWYNGNVVKALPDYPLASLNAISNLDSGYYTLRVTNTSLGCASLPKTAQVTNTTTLPVIITGTTPSTNCTPGQTFADGTARVVTIDGGAAPGANYTYAWSSSNAPATFTVDNLTNHANTHQLIKVQGGNVGATPYRYSVLVTNTNTGCQNTANVNVADAKVLPVVTLAATDNHVCAPATSFDGAISASITPATMVGAISNYSFSFGGGSVAGTQLASPNHNQYTKLNGGPTPYTVTATHTPTGCVSSQVSIPVSNTQDLPDLVTSGSPSTNCTLGAGLEDGIARVVTVDGANAPGANYSYVWSGSVAPAFAVNNPTNNANTHQLIKVQGGAGYTYSVLVTNTVNGCSAAANVNVADGKVLPLLTLTPQPNSICDPVKAGTAFNGSVSAVVNNIPGGNTVNDYFFNWSAGTDGNGILSSTGLDVGIYSVTALHNRTGCLSNVYNAQVTNAKIIPVVTMGQTAAQYCAGGTPDGTAKVLNVVPNGQNYDYKWFDGNSTAGTAGPVTLNSTATTNNYSNVQGGINGMALFQYTVEVTILQSGCVNTATVGVDNDSQLPVVTLQPPVDNTNCKAAKNGSAALNTLSYRGNSITAPYTGFTFVWSGGGTVGSAPGETYTALAAGNYTLTVTNTADNCISNPAPVTIMDDLFIPPIDIVAVDQTSCNPLTPNGSLTATVDETTLPGLPGVVAGYTFTWVNDITAASTVSNAISNLKGDQTYTITALHNSTECASTQQVYLNETLVTPSVAVVVQAMTTCSPANGSLTATVTPAGPTYNYFWYNGSDAIDEDAVIAGADFTGGALYSNLNPGDYTLVAQDATTQCKSQQVIRTIVNNAPGIQPLAVNTTIPTDCQLAGGALDGGVQLTVNPNNFTSNDVTNQLTTTTPLGLAVNSMVVITKTGALPVPLEADKIYFIQSIAGNLIRLSLTSGGAAIDITANGVGSIGDFKTVGHTYEWYAGVPSPTDPSLGSINYFTNPPVYTAGPLSTSASLAGIPTGLYTLQVTNTATGCKTYLPHTLPFLGSHAVLKITKTNSNICPYVVGNGSIEIQIEDPAAAPVAIDQNDYEVTLFKSGVPIVATFNPIPPVNPFTISNSLAPGSYTVEVRETYSGTVPGCVITQDVIIDADALAPVITLTAIASNTACDLTAADGQIDINVDKDPADLTAGTTYNIDMAPDPNAAFPLMAQLAGNYSALNLAPTGYTFTVTASSGCSTTKSYTVLDNPVLTQFAATDLTITAAEYCNLILEQSAKVTIDQINLIGGGTEMLADYEFIWKNLTTNTVVFTLQGDAAGSTTGGDEFINQVPMPANGTVPAGTVWAGSYSVAATKTLDANGTGGIGCTSPAFNITVASQLITPLITLTPTGDTACDPAGNEGSIEVDVITASGPGNGSTYNYVWTPNGGVGEPANSIGNSGVNNMQANIDDGSYSLTATNTVTACPATLTTTVIKNAPPVFTVTADAFNLTNCTPANFDGRINNIQVFIDGLGGNEADFDYTWFKTDLLGAPIIDGINNVTYPVDDQLTLVTYPAIAVDKYFVKAIRKGGGIGIGCESVPVRKDILDNRTSPQLSMSSVANNACLAPNWDGSITVSAGTTGFGAGTMYNFIWMDDPGPATTNIIVSNGMNVVSAAPVVPSLLSLSNYTTPASDQIGAGSYMVRVTNQTNTCFTDANVVVQQNTVPINVTNTTSSPLTHCTVPNGSVNVTGISVGGVSATLGEFTYNWTGTGGPYVGIPVNNLLSGDYIVTATKNSIATNRTAFGCSSAPLTVKVLDQRITPTVSFAQVANSACDNINFDGQITVTATTASGPGVGSNYNFVWTNDPDGIAGTAYSASSSMNTASPYSTPVTDLIGDGAYSIAVTNVNTTCASTGMVVVQKNPALIALTATKTDQTICTPPDGSITVTGVTRDGNAEVAGNFNFHWYKNSTASPEIVPVAAGNNILNAADLTVDAGTYFVKAVRRAVMPIKGTGCESAPFRVNILDASQDPDLDFTKVRPDSSCSAVINPLGLISATASERDATVDNYTFNWTLNGGSLHPSTTQSGISPVSQLTNASLGTYAVTVTNTVTGCTFNQNIVLTQDPTRSLPSIVDVLSTNPTDCNNTGSARVVEITIGGTVSYTNPPDNLDALTFTFDWYKNNISSPIAGATTSTLTNQSQGKYFVRVVETVSACPSAFVEVVIDSANIIYPVIASRQTSPQVICDIANLGGSASLAATADIGKPVNSRNTLTRYEFSWYPLLDTLGVALALPLSDTTIINRIEGDYSVKVRDVITNCKTFSNFIIENDSTEFKPILSLTSGPLTECDSINGYILARGLHIAPPVPPPAAEIYPFAYVYTADFYTGQPADLDNPGPDLPNIPVSSGPVSENFMQPNLVDGIYTVRMNDANTGCSTINIVTVNDERIYPKPEIVSIAPLTNCYGNKPNGIAQASILDESGNDVFVGYSFEWFEGTIPAGLPLYTGVQFDSLKAAPVKYVVRATNLITGCSDSTITDIESDILSIPMPLIRLISDNTSCDTDNPNGALFASVNENTIDYNFAWYDDADGVLTLSTNITPLYDSLARDTYGVTAQSKITGCISPLATKAIQEHPEYPGLSFLIHKATCGLSDGSINITIITPVAIDTIQWFNDFGAVPGNEIAGGVGTILRDMMSGKYSVSVTTILGCTTAKNVELEPEIHPFNGISHDTPGLNDYFHIDCIQNFTVDEGAKRDNVVRIYNRAGTLVYEAHGYDNVNTYFDGKSNKGISPMGTNLPDGTYFYIVDKNDGSKARVGYLEIVK